MAESPDDTPTRILAVADRLARLRPDWRSAERFYEERSELKAELKALANGPTMVRQVTRFVRVEPEPTAPVPAPPALPPAPAEPLLAGSVPLILTEGERQVVRRVATSDWKGGFPALFRKLHARINPATGELVLLPDEVTRIWDWGSRPGKGGYQSYTRKVFWRSMGALFVALPLVAGDRPRGVEAQPAPPVSEAEAGAETGGGRVIDANSHGNKLEFVCAVCLRSAYALDTDPRRPKCPRGHGTMEPDSWEAPGCAVGRQAARTPKNGVADG